VLVVGVSIDRKGLLGLLRGLTHPEDLMGVKLTVGSATGVSADLKGLLGLLLGLTQPVDLIGVRLDEDPAAALLTACECQPSCTAAAAAATTAAAAARSSGMLLLCAGECGCCPSLSCVLVPFLESHSQEWAGLPLVAEIEMPL
jgi:hypothetical protein